MGSRLSSEDGAAPRFRLGAATTVRLLHLNQRWFVDDDRDIEIGDCAERVLLDSPEETRAIAAEANALLEGHRGRRGIHGPFRGIPLNSPDSEIQAVVARRYTQAIRFAAAFGGSHMVIHSPFAGWISPFTFGGDPVELRRSIDCIRATLEPVIPVAEEHGVMLVIENIRDLNCFPILRTVETINHPLVRLSLDVGHCQLHVPLGGMPPDQYILETGDWLQHLHIQDNDSLSDRHWAPGQGSINFHAIFSALRQVQTDPRMIIELKDKAAIQSGAGHLITAGYGA